MARRLPKPVQLELPVPTPRTWGGRRAGAGRKPTGGYGRRPGGRPVSGVSHLTRPALAARAPLHVTVRAGPGGPNLRNHAVAREVGALLKRRALRALPCRVVHFALLHDHLHFIVEAQDRRALARGMQGLLSGLARVINRTTGCDGKLWNDRYHARALKTPTEVRTCLIHVLRNAAKHGSAAFAVDPCSSAAWLLRVGWQRAGGPIGAREAPSTA